jgi:hypothetical protein
VIVIEGGFECETEAHCQSTFEDAPQLFSSRAWPSEMDGDTLLSPEDEVNPVASNFEHWMFPDCTRDYWIGNKQATNGGLSFLGDRNMLLALDHWAASVKTMFTGGVPTDKKVIFVAHRSATGVLNHASSLVAATIVAGVSKVGAR